MSQRLARVVPPYRSGEPPCRIAASGRPADQRQHGIKYAGEMKPKIITKIDVYQGTQKQMNYLWRL
jgi:hypothetical protein